MVFLQTAALGGPTLLSSPFFINMVLPFILVFTVIFAILQKSKILGEGKRQIDAIVALVIALIVISFANAVGIIISLIPFLAISVVVILVFLILYAMAFQGKTEFGVDKGIRITIGIIVTIGVVVTVMLATGAWEYIKDNIIYGAGGSPIISNAIFLIIIAAAIVAVVWGAKGEGKS